MPVRFVFATLCQAPLHTTLSALVAGGSDASQHTHTHTKKRAGDSIVLGGCSDESSGTDSR
eukprot:15480598-Alexandrium_andersonii.AAC.1